MSPDLTDELVQQILSSGYAVVRNAVEPECLDHFQSMITAIVPTDASGKRSTSLYGVRQLLSVLPGLRAILMRTPFIELAQRILGESARPVKGIYFDKTQEANWPVPWHQDVTITIRERRDVPGFEMRPVTEGLVHAIPPVELSQQILALRIHLDDAAADHGALRVIAGSHLCGRLAADALHRQISAGSEQTVAVRRGDIMLMRPLLLHASSPCQRPDHRRVIHVEYASFDLPSGLEWAG